MGGIIRVIIDIITVFLPGQIVIEGFLVYKNVIAEVGMSIDLQLLFDTDYFKS